MWDFRFSVQEWSASLPADVDRTFFWARAGTTPWFTSNVGPLLGSFGQVADPNIDLVRIGSAVLAADRSASRSGSLSRWNARAIHLTIDVLDPDAWARVGDRLERLLGFLTGDDWHLDFTFHESAPEQIGSVGIDAQRVVLLSGGADSATGALLSGAELAHEGKKQVLVSHWSAPVYSPVQSRVAAEIERLAPGSQADHVKVHHARRRHSPSGKAYGHEDSTRSRSLLFIALGLAVASVNAIPLWIPENGYASINPPLSKSRRGSLSTKTTHPKFFEDLAALLADVGAHHDFVNPFADITKGEMFTRVRAEVGDTEASSFLSGTNSCSHTGARSFGRSPNISCGVCFGCVLRRASFHASGITDSTPYLKPADAKQLAWLDGKSVIPAMRDFLASRFGVTELARLQIPSNLSLADVEALCDRGRDELRGIAL